MRFTDPYRDANNSVLSPLPELGTMGSKRGGSWGDPLPYQLVSISEVRVTPHHSRQVFCMTIFGNDWL